MRKKFLLSLFFLLIIPSALFAEETQDLAADYVSRIQNEISSDISNLRSSIETGLEGLKLESLDITNRIHELERLTATASDDMAAWGYTSDESELHTHILSELITAYSAYGSLQQSSLSQNLSSNDIAALRNIASPDINYCDNLRQVISRVSRGLDIQAFYLQSKISKLRLELAEVASLQKQLKSSEEGSETLALPHTHLLTLENARISAALTRLQVRTLKADFDSNVTDIFRLRRQLANMQDKISFPKGLLDANIEALQERIRELSEETANAKKSLESANSALKRARASLTSADTKAMTTASTTYTARSARVNYWEYMTAMINEEITLTREVQEIWRKRYRLFHDEASGDEIWRYREDAGKRILELQKELDGIRSIENVILREIDTLQSQANSDETRGIVQQNLMQAAENKRRIISEVLNRYESFIPNVIFYQQRLYNEANDNLSAIRLAEKVGSFSKETVMNFLETELWQGEGYSVTVSKLVIAILVFLSSFFLSSVGSHWIKRRMINRFKASITAANAVQRIVFYILWVAFVLIALNIVKIPLTAFAFMGGAIALGIGFGMQNIFNNLISGFIVIFSRPFKVKDIVEVAGTQGVVEDIGSRSTTIRTWDGLDVILPNRYFLENSVTNWVRSDFKKRERLNISVSYDADSRQVEKLLYEIVNEHSKVLKDPAPLIVFNDFGSDGLEFIVYYWIDLKTSAGIKVSSDIRHHIVSVFRRDGINIPYPQRVLHIAGSVGGEGSENPSA